MQSESQGPHDMQVEDMPIEDMQREVKPEVKFCPNCKMEDPKGVYCLRCGYPLYLKDEEQPQQDEGGFGVEETSEAEETESLSDAVVESEVPPLSDEAEFSEETAQGLETEVEPEEGDAVSVIDSVRVRALGLANRYRSFWRGSQSSELEEKHFPEAPESVEDVGESLMEASQIVEEGSFKEDAVNIEADSSYGFIGPVAIESQEQAAGSASAHEPDPISKDVMENLVKSISLELWSVNMLREGDIEEEHFNKLFDGYVTRSELFMRCRDEMLESARDMDSIESALTEAKVNLSELKMKETLGDISEEEYRAKAPAFQWDVNKYKVEISRRKAEIEFLDDLTNVTSWEEISRMKEKAEEYHDAVDSLEESGRVSSETAESVKASLEKVVNCLVGSEV